MDAGFNGTTLAIFTSLAPAGMLAFALLGLYALAHIKSKPENVHALNPWLAVPLSVTWLGFIASATHLGMPSNALYVLAGIGRSPLSNEVAAVVGFLFFSGIYWLYTFKIGYHKILARALMTAAVLFAFLGVFFSSRAYAIATIPSWNVWYTAANLWLSGLAGGGALASATLFACSTFSTHRAAERPWHAGFLCIAAASVLIGTIVLHLQAGYLEGVSNNVAALNLVSYRAAILRHTLECLAGIALMALPLEFLKDSRIQGPLVLAGLLFLAVGILVTRLAFYDLYLSVGF